MTGAEIITQFEMQVGDVTELSTSEELIVLNRVYLRVCGNRPWEFLKTNATGSVTTDNTGTYITLPADFSHFYENYNYTNNAISTQINQAPKVIFIGTNKSPYYIVNYADRNQYTNHGGYCYLDLANNKLVFTSTPTEGTTYSMDYIKAPAKLTTSTSPVFPERFQDILVYGMAAQNDIVQLSPKAKSYAPENKGFYDELLAEMTLWNSNLINS